MTKRKLKKKIKRIVLLFITILIVLTITMVLIKNNKKENNIEQKVEINTINNKLKSLNYSDEEIGIINKYVSDDNIDYIVSNNIDKEIVINFVNQDYYIDDYLVDYLNYYNENNYSYREVTERVNTHVNNDYYTHTIPTDETVGKFVLLNKYYYASEDYKADDLIDVDAEYSLYNNSFKLSEECYNAFLKMYNDAKDLGYGFKINSPYRSYQTQVKIYNRYVATDGVEQADTYSARPGYSEHQTGYAFDIRDFPYTNEDYSKTRSFTWVSENSYKYGFIIRFPKDKEEITGYQYEPWHYRYCGTECATYIHKTNITFEEYYEYFIKYKNPKNLS